MLLGILSGRASVMSVTVSVEIVSVPPGITSEMSPGSASLIPSDSDEKSAAQGWRGAWVHRPRHRGRSWASSWRCGLSSASKAEKRSVVLSSSSSKSSCSSCASNCSSWDAAALQRGGKGERRHS